MHPFSEDIKKLHSTISKAVLGKADVIEQVLICLMAQGHLLIEDVPGVGKTTLALALAEAIDSTFHRIQFTSDLLPSDVLGVTIYNSDSRDFEFKPGPIFANVVLADEINRTTPKTQSALLEAMQDGRVTVERTTHELPHPFMVLATQNPVEFHGTYALPESQLDRFLMRISMGYPQGDAELEILETKDYVDREPHVEPVISHERVLEMQRAVSKVTVDSSISRYLLDIVRKTRENRDLELGVSTRGSLALYRAAQARAFVQDRLYVTPADVKTLVMTVFGHRVVVSSQHVSAPSSHDAHLTVEGILSEILENVEVPV